MSFKTFMLKVAARILRDQQLNMRSNDMYLDYSQKVSRVKANHSFDNVLYKIDSEIENSKLPSDENKS